jgi:nicotinate-nucleotide pyrophosphorylase (carboxylating)
MVSELPERVVRDIVARALAEDVGPGDLTTLATIDADAQCQASVEARAGGVIAGIPVARHAFLAVDSQIAFDALVHDGDGVSAGRDVAQLAGSTRAVLTSARIVDTRKTAPGLRLLDKYAVRMGGGSNHRVGLFDGILIKDNHLRAAGGVSEAVRRARAAAHHLVRVEVEVQTLDEVEEAIEARADAVLLDNMELTDVREAVGLVAGRCEVEVSGGVTLDTVRELAECGVDYISVGALTHSAPALDLALEIADD